MPTTEQLICPKCQGTLATVFTGTRPRRRTFLCPKCDKATDPMQTVESQGWISGSELKPPE
ncbi:MAG: hypothetical protein ABIO35_07940 [Nitrobacter sp.]